MKLKILLGLLLCIEFLPAQFPGPVGSPNSTAIHKDSSIFNTWASGCIVSRGWQDIADENLGITDAGEAVNGTGKAGENPVVSLGDGGYAILTFSKAIRNGPGYDFAVFENAFNDFFLELAYVDVSSDGVNYIRFPAHSHTSYTTQIGPFDEAGDATKLHNLAGKYRGGYGTPFDLNDLEGSPNLNLQAITHVKITDVVGCISAPFARYDSNNSPINDPYPTPFGSGGFDLDAVGVIHSAPVGIEDREKLNSVMIYPNPCRDHFFIDNKQKNLLMSVINTAGELVYTSHINKPTRVETHSMPSGIYVLKLQTENGFITKKIHIKSEEH